MKRAPSFEFNELVQNEVYTPDELAEIKRLVEAKGKKIDDAPDPSSLSLKEWVFYYVSPMVSRVGEVTPDSRFIKSSTTPPDFVRWGSTVDKIPEGDRKEELKELVNKIALSQGVQPNDVFWGRISHYLQSGEDPPMPATVRAMREGEEPDVSARGFLDFATQLNNADISAQALYDAADELSAAEVSGDPKQIAQAYRSVHNALDQIVTSERHPNVGQWLDAFQIAIRDRMKEPTPEGLTFDRPGTSRSTGAREAVGHLVWLTPHDASGQTLSFSDDISAPSILWSEDGKVTPVLKRIQDGPHVGWWYDDNGVRHEEPVSYYEVHETGQSPITYEPGTKVPTGKKTVTIPKDRYVVVTYHNGTPHYKGFDVWEDAQEYAESIDPDKDGSMDPNVPDDLESKMDKEGFGYQRGFTWLRTNKYAVVFKPYGKEDKYRDTLAEPSTPAPQPVPPDEQSLAFQRTPDNPLTNPELQEFVDLSKRQLASQDAQRAKKQGWDYNEDDILDFEEMYQISQRKHQIERKYSRGVVGRAVYQQSYNDFRDAWATAYRPNKPKDQVEAEIKQHLDDLFRDKPIAIRTTQAALGHILESGRVKTQYETNRSKGLKDFDTRMAYEEMLFDIPKGHKLTADDDGIPVQERPVYGYVAVNGLLPSGLGSAEIGDPETDALGQYGQFQIVLKDSVKPRTTAMVGDSLNNQHQGAPSPVLDPDIKSFSPSVQPGDHELSRDYSGGVMTNGIRGDRSLEDYEDITFRSKNYAEAHVHGGVTLDDIEEILVPSKPGKALREKLDASGIPWRVFNYQTMIESTDGDEIIRGHRYGLQDRLALLAMLREEEADLERYEWENDEYMAGFSKKNIKNIKRILAGIPEDIG